MRLIASTFPAPSPLWYRSGPCFLFHWLLLSFLNPVWTETNTADGESCSGVNWSISVRARGDSVAFRHSAVSRGESEHKARTANQLVPTSPVAKRRLANQDRVQRVSLTGQIEQEQKDFNQSLMQRHDGKTQRSRDTLRPHHLLIAFCVL